MTPPYTTLQWGNIGRIVRVSLFEIDHFQNGPLPNSKRATQVRMRTPVAQLERVHCVVRPDPYPIRIGDNSAEIVGLAAAGVPSFPRRMVADAEGKSLSAVARYRMPIGPSEQSRHRHKKGATARIPASVRSVCSAGPRREGCSYRCLINQLPMRRSPGKRIVAMKRTPSRVPIWGSRVLWRST